MSPQPAPNTRILIVDDNEDIHRDFRQILMPGEKAAVLSRMDQLEAAIMGEPAAPQPPRQQSFELTSAFQGAEALARVQQALKDGAPYALVFIDIRMPPGWDGFQTLTRLWQEDPHLQAVLCSAYSDYTWETLQAQYGKTDRLLILKKPFDPVEVRQMAGALVEKWNREAALRRGGQATHGSEATLRTLLQVLSHALVRVGADGTCLDFQTPQDTPASRWPAFLPGRKLSDVLPEDTARQWLSCLHQALRDGTQHVLEHEQTVHGEQRRFESRLAVSEGGEVLILLRDITQR
jgi:CheY-like chemotaxis protein